MSTNLRKAQKHMHRAKELLNQGQLGFGANNDGKEEKESSSKRKRTPEESPKLEKKPRIPPEIHIFLDSVRHSGVTRETLYYHLKQIFPTFEIENLILKRYDNEPLVHCSIDSRLCDENKVDKFRVQIRIIEDCSKMFGKGEVVRVRYHTVESLHEPSQT